MYHEFHHSWSIRKDEEPFVHKIPEGGNWKSLDIEDQKAFMKGTFNSGGGRTGFLAVMNKDKPTRTIMSSPMGKNNAQILRFSSTISVDIPYVKRYVYKLFLIHGVLIKKLQL
jgi:hypothetical protein